MTPEELLVQELKNEAQGARNDAETLRQQMVIAQQRAFAYDRAADRVEAYFQKNKEETN